MKTCRVTTRPAKLLKWIKSSPEACSSSRLTSWGLSQQQSVVHPPSPKTRWQQGNECSMCAAVDCMDTGRHCTAWDGNLTTAVRGKTVSTVTAVSAYIVHIPRMTAEWLQADKRRKCIEHC